MRFLLKLLVLIGAWCLFAVALLILSLTGLRLSGPYRSAAEIFWVDVLAAAAFVAIIALVRRLYKKVNVYCDKRDNKAIYEQLMKEREKEQLKE